MSVAAAERRLFAAVFTASLLLYLSFRSLYFNFDGIACATAVELSDFKHLVHGNHLAYGVLGWLFDQSWRLLGYGGRAILPLQVLDGILGAAGAAVFAGILLRAGRSEREAALGGAALAVSQAWWFWSLEAQVYMLGALFAALAAREALADRPSPALLGLWHAGAVLGHAGHAMALPALVFLLTRKRGWGGVPRYAGVLAGTVLACYAAAGVFAVRPQTLDEVRVWLLGSAALGNDRAFSWHAPTLAGAFPDWGRMTLRIFCDFSSAGRSGAVWAAGVVLSLLPLAAAAVGAVRGGREGRFWLLWLAGYAALYLTWEPSTVVYRVSDLMALWALAQMGLALRPYWARSAALACWVAAAFAYNLAFRVLPATDPAVNPGLVEARWVGARVPADAWVLTINPIYLSYFMGIKPLNLRYVKDGDVLAARLDALEKNGEAADVTDRTLDQDGVRAALERYGLEDAAAGEGLTLYRIRRAAAKKGRSR